MKVYVTSLKISLGSPTISKLLEKGMMYCKNPYSELQEEAHEPEFVRRVMIQGKIAERYSATKFFLFISFYRVLVFVFIRIQMLPL